MVISRGSSPASTRSTACLPATIVRAAASSSGSSAASRAGGTSGSRLRMRRFDVEGTAAAGRTVDGCIIPLLYTMTREHAAAAGFAFARERHELRGVVHPDRVEPADRSFPTCTRVI